MKEIVETMYYYARKINISNEQYYDIREKQPIAPGQNSELIDLLTRIFSKEHSEFNVLIDASNHYLNRDLQLIGAYFIGYMCILKTDVDNSTIDNDTSLTFVPFEKFDSSKYRCSQIVLTIDGNFQYVPGLDVKNYFLSNQHRERYYLGITNMPVYKPEQNLRHYEYETDLHNDITISKNQSFDNVVALRESANDFKNSCAIEFNDMLKLYQDTIWHRNGKCKIATTGDFCDYKIVFINFDNNKSYITFTPDQILKSKHSFSQNHFSNITFGQDTFSECKTWAIIIANPTRLMLKYGRRAYRFLFLDVGGLVQQMHLSATSINIHFRATGESDDLVLSKLLGLEESDIVACLAGLGKYE